MIKSALLDQRGRRQILVCDDERHITRLLQVNLERQGHVVTCAFDGEEAIRELAPEVDKFDNVILDLMMPKVDGSEVLKWIRTHEHTRHLWVALMIPKSTDREVWEQSPYQADMYLVKPFDPADLFP